MEWSPSLCFLCSLLLLSPGHSAPQNVLKMKTEVDEFDWRDKGVISPVSNQGQMGNVMDIVIPEGVESLHAIETQQSVILLSREEVADCCDGEFHQPKYKGFECIVVIGGLCTLTTYKTGQGCGNKTCTPVGKVGSTGYIPSGREDIMVKVILETPLVAYVDASQTSFQEYTSGIYSDPNCKSNQLDHAVQIVGFGSSDGQDYWTVKNSWGVNWGEDGYMRLARGKNMCGIATNTFYPIGLEHH